jgi:hyperosmotically inducible protein
MTFEAYSIDVPNRKQVRSVKMKRLLSLIAALALIASGAAWAGEQWKQQSGKSSQKTFKSSETFLEGQAGPEYGKEQEERTKKQSQEATGQQQQQTKGQESEQSAVGEYMDDAMITTKVKAALAKDPAASALAISVETTKGTVQLSGAVDSAEEKMKAESIARSVEGVRGVENKLTVK